jgi:hypothetical protein
MATPAAPPPDANEGFVQIYAHALNFPVKRGTDPKAPQDLIFKILIFQHEDVLERVRFQLSDEEELGFLYEATYDVARFNGLKDADGLEFDFPDLANVVRQLLNELIKQADAGQDDPTYKAVFKIDVPPEARDPPAEPQDEEEEEPGPANLFIISQLLNLRRVPLLTLEFDQCPPERSTAVSQARYNELVAKYKEIWTEYNDILKRLERQAPKTLQSFKPATDRAT